MEIQRIAAEAINQIELVGHEVQHQLDATATPWRKHVLKRFPILFLLLGTFGFVATYVGIELLLLQYSLFMEKPWILLIIGLATLIITGTLYKRLG